MSKYLTGSYRTWQHTDRPIRMHDVLVIYKQVSMQFDEDGNLMPFEGVPVHTLSYDGKPWGTGHWDDDRRQAANTRHG